MAENRFLLPVEEYRRSINPIKDWVKQTAFYASKMLDRPLDDCINHLQAKLKAGQIEYKNPIVLHYERGENGDREKVSTTLAAYIQRTIANNEILAPTFTTYLHPDVKRSVIVDLLDRNVAERKKYKKISQKYESEGNMLLYKYNDRIQDAKKRKNNSVSGGFVAEGSVINNKSAHSTLTSITRSIASLSNASNERIIEGNRHYFTPQIALNNLISICTEADKDAIADAIECFNLKYPSVDDTMQCVTRSTRLYMLDRKAEQMLRAFIEKLDHAERAAIVYTGDFYHLRVFNDAFIRGYIEDFSRRGSIAPIDNPIDAINATDEQVVNYAHQINITMLRGKGKDYAKLTQDEQYILANTCRNIEAAIEKYRPILRAFFLTKNSPCTIATIPNMIRRTVVLSDTDSTMFSCDNWVEWYFGKLVFSDDGYAVAGAVMFMATQSIAHILALFSANMNVEKSRLFTLAMKPEYVFPVFAQTSVAKHYYTAMMVKEGNVYPEPKMEIKGVHMKDSTVPGSIIPNAAKLMKRIISTIMASEEVDLEKTLRETAETEQSIIQSLYKGETTYLKRFKIKEETAYKLSRDESPYLHYTLWEEVFAPKYGKCEAPPYNAVRIPLNIANKSAMATWLGQIGDQEFATRLATWLQRNNKDVLGSIAIPMDHCRSHGVPEELKLVMDTRKIVITLTKSYRNILESLGYYPKHDFLVSELINIPAAL